MQRFTSFSLIVFVLVISTVSAATWAQPTARTEIVLKGTYGDGARSLGYVSDGDSWIAPSGITVDRNNNVYIADGANKRILKLDQHANHLLTITLSDPVNDLAVDEHGRLVVAATGALYLYEADGQLRKEIDLDRLEIHWDSRKKQWSKGSVQVERISTGPANVVYIAGFNELIRLNTDTLEVQKWSDVRPSVGYALTQDGALYLIVIEGSASGKSKALNLYRPSGHLARQQPCGNPPSRRVGGTDCWLPKFIDEDGASYWFANERGDLSTAGSTLRIYNAGGSLVNDEVLPKNIGKMCDQNICKFGRTGELFYLELKKEGFELSRTVFSREK